MTVTHKQTMTHPGEDTRTALWAHPCAGLWVARIGGDYAGMVEHRRQYAVFDSASNPIGSFATLAEAKRALVDGEHLAAPERRIRRERGGSGAES